MPRPIVYHSNLFSSPGTLSGTHDANDNLVGRVADGSVNLAYDASTVAITSGVMQVILTTAARPDALVLARAGAISGARFILESEDVGGGNNATELDFVPANNTVPLVQTISGGTARQVWRLTVSGGTPPVQLYEAQLATQYQVPRSPELQVTRTRVRQFTRVPVAGGQPFVKRNGPGLRRTLCTFVLISGTEVTEAEAFVDAVEGGQAFTLVDDRAETYWAELLESDVAFNDNAGIFTVSLTFQEISAEL